MNSFLFTTPAMASLHASNRRQIARQSALCYGLRSWNNCLGADYKLKRMRTTTTFICHWTSSYNILQIGLSTAWMDRRTMQFALTWSDNNPTVVRNNSRVHRNKYDYRYYLCLFSQRLTVTYVAACARMSLKVCNLM